MQQSSNYKSKLLVIVFLAIIVLPACYAAYKELKHRQQKEVPMVPAENSK